MLRIFPRQESNVLRLLYENQCFVRVSNGCSSFWSPFEIGKELVVKDKVNRA